MANGNSFMGVESFSVYRIRGARYSARKFTENICLGRTSRTLDDSVIWLPGG